MTPFKVPEKPRSIEEVMQQLGEEFEKSSPGSSSPPPPIVSRALQSESFQDDENLLQRAEEGCAVAPDYRIKSHRRVIGPVLDLFKRIVHWGSRPYVDLLIENQERFNRAIMAVLRRQNQRIEEHEGRLRTLVERMDFCQPLVEEHHARYDFSPFLDQISKEKRLDFMERFRGPFQEIWGRHHVYLDIFRNRPGPILDVGSGRGEFLHMLRGEGIPAWGCDVDPLMVEAALKKEVYVRCQDALTALTAIESSTLGGVFSSHVVEHFFPGDFLTFLKLARERIAPGGVLVLATLNTQSLAVLAKSLYRDLEHKLPIDPDFMAALMELAGFERVETHFSMPFEASDRLPELPGSEELGLSAEAHAALQAITDRLNSTIWGPQDYYVVGELPSTASRDEASPESAQ